MDKTDKELYRIMESYIQQYVNNPIIQIIEKNPIENLKITTQLCFLKILTDGMLNSSEYIDTTRVEKLDHNKKNEFINSLNDYIQNGEADKNTKEILDKCILDKSVIPYIFREMHWILISILSASYISAHILTRSIFELIITYLTSDQNSGMSDKIDQIGVINSEQKKLLKQHWKKLNKWAHPYGHWIKNICPIYISHKPIYHESLCDECISDVQINIELLIIMALEIFNVDVSVFNSYLDGKDLLTYDLLDEVQKKKIRITTAST